MYLSLSLCLQIYLCIHLCMHVMTKSFGALSYTPRAVQGATIVLVRPASTESSCRLKQVATSKQHGEAGVAEADEIPAKPTLERACCNPISTFRGPKVLFSKLRTRTTVHHTGPPNRLGVLRFRRNTSEPQKHVAGFLALTRPVLRLGIT